MTDSSADKVGSQKTNCKAILFGNLVCSPANPLARIAMSCLSKMNQFHEELRQFAED